MSLIAFMFMINNSLNISNFYNYKISLRREKMAFQLIIGLIGVYMLQYFIIGFNYGSKYATAMAFDNMLYGLMIVTFLAILFSSITINRGEWKAISVFSFIPYVKIFHNQNKSIFVCSPSCCWCGNKGANNFQSKRMVFS